MHCRKLGLFRQSVKATEAGGPRRYDAGKKIKGRKRHIVTDTLGGLLESVAQVTCSPDFMPMVS